LGSENGIIEWDNTIGGDANDDLYSIDQTTDGGIIIGGESTSNISDDKTENMIGAPFVVDDDYWIVKINSSGTVVWDNTIGGTDEEDFTAVVATNDGGYIIGGFSSSGISGDKTENSIGNSDYWVVKINPEIICNPPSGIYANNITSSSAKIHWNPVTGATKYQINYRPIAGEPWLKKNSLTTTKNITGLIPNTIYEYKIKVVCGDEASPFYPLNNFTTLPLKEGGISNGSISENNLIVIYPNPADDNLFIQLNKSISNPQITILDMYGNKVSNINSSINSDLISIDISSLPKGVYILQIQNDQLNNSMRFVHQ